MKLHTIMKWIQDFEEKKNKELCQSQVKRLVSELFAFTLVPGANPKINIAISLRIFSHNKSFLLYFPHITIPRILLDDNPMAGFIDTLRGDGLARAQRALARLDGDSLRLDRERQRFSHSPLSTTIYIESIGYDDSICEPQPPQRGVTTLPGATNAAGRGVRGLRTTQPICCSGRGREEADLECRSEYELDEHTSRRCLD